MAGPGGDAPPRTAGAADAPLAPPTQQQQATAPRPAAAFSVLSNARGSAVEDTFVLQDDLLFDTDHPDCVPVVPLFGVYDGHGGGAAAQHCARRLHHFVAARLQALLRRGPVDGRCPLDTPAVEAALRDAFVATDAELRAGGSLDASSGSTALVALLTPCSIWLAWAGDSRGVLPYGLTPEPEVMVLPRRPDDEFLVLASDGLWDKVSPQEAATLAHNAWSRVSAAATGGAAADDSSPSNSGSGNGSSSGGSNNAGDGGGIDGKCDAAAAAAAAADGREDRAAPAGPAPQSPPSPPLASPPEGAPLCASPAASLRREGSGCVQHPPPPPPGRTCCACKAARIAAAAMTRCARSRRSRDDTTVVVVNLQQSCLCARSWATVGGGSFEEELLEGSGGSREHGLGEGRGSGGFAQGTAAGGEGSGGGGSEGGSAEGGGAQLAAAARPQPPVLTSIDSGSAAAAAAAAAATAAAAAEARDSGEAGSPQWLRRPRAGLSGGACGAGTAGSRGLDDEEARTARLPTADEEGSSFTAHLGSCSNGLTALSPFAIPVRGGSDGLKTRPSPESLLPASRGATPAGTGSGGGSGGVSASGGGGSGGGSGGVGASNSGGALAALTQRLSLGAFGGGSRDTPA
ncbi:transketolase [Raphidocelis subcapitata]|uniref:protein-serine/threonine phosphatase n=1 Tax=Raphidocelis subcapitata TaxID=307507 RepID=A0A2V0PPH7_9CHLO|nr:transketolase [Raphidocelis subcapitata]|eukprot:GBG00074.1 transketolase [Raphidocelis subcapitata]